LIKLMKLDARFWSSHLIETFKTLSAVDIMMSSIIIFLLLLLPLTIKIAYYII
jgi:hypothetical protein